MTTTKVIDCFNGDTLAQNVWNDKYAMKDKDGNILEKTPADMHMRMAKEFARVEWKYIEIETEGNKSVTGFRELSDFGKKLYNNRLSQSLQEIEQEIFSYFDHFSRIIPQGSIMSNLGNKHVFGSLSNCFTIESPLDSYGGICKADQELVQLMKRRGGVGMTLDNLRPSNSTVTNAAKTSSGVPSFAERFSNSTREVAQEGRRGALMLLLSCKHPDIFKFVSMKSDRTKVTGANVSVMLTDEFMKAVGSDNDDFICTFPVDRRTTFEPYNYNELSNNVMKIHARELFNLISQMAHENAEPGIAFIDRIKNYCPDGVYKMYAPTECNPCAEIWMSDYETCRLIAQNYFTIINKPFTNEATINIDKLYEQSYMQQRLGDDLVDLEVECIDRIINKILSDPQPIEIKQVELNLWQKVKTKAQEGRRTGSGFTGLGDAIAALGFKYDSDEAKVAIELISRTKMEAELDCTIDMAILRGTFTGWSRDKEFKSFGYLKGENSFYQMLFDEFPEQVNKMYNYGRRNVSWSTVAPTGTVSLMTQTTSGLEPLFKAYYIRRKKINPSESNSRVDFVDQNGDKWMEYPVLHPKFKEWIKNITISNMEFIGDGMLKGYKLERRDMDEELLDEMVSMLDKNKIQEFFEQSPWYGSEADNIDWGQRVQIQSIIQKYTSNAISSTINLHKDVSKELVGDIYKAAYKAGLKGITVYRDGSRSGVLVTETEKKVVTNEFGYNDAPKRPKELEAHYYWGKNGHEYAIIIGLLNGKPYEIFAFANPLMTCELKGKIIKHESGKYSFESNLYTIDHLELSSDHKDEILLTRFASLMLRHGANPKFIAEQVEKSQMSVVSFPKIISRILKLYIPDQETKEKCSECGEKTMIYEEGCKKCSSCGHSKC